TADEVAAGMVRMSPADAVRAEQALVDRAAAIADGPAVTDEKLKAWKLKARREIEERLVERRKKRRLMRGDDSEPAAGRRRSNGPLAALILGLACASSGCAIDRMAANGMVPVLRRTDEQFERSRSVKAAREAGPGLPVTLDGLVATSPENAELLELAAQMNATFAFAFLEETDPAWASDLYEKAQGYALRALKERCEIVWAELKSTKPSRSEEHTSELQSP